MLSIAIQAAIWGTFIALSILFWRMSKRPRWKIRTVIYGWGALFIWALFWCGLLPMWLQGTIDSKTLNRTFPEGTIVAAMLAGGWFWPLLMVGLRDYKESRSGKERQQSSNQHSGPGQ